MSSPKNACVGGYRRRWVIESISISNDHDDHNDDFKKTIGLMIRTTSPHVHHAF